MESVRDPQNGPVRGPHVVGRAAGPSELAFDSGSFRDRTARIFIHHNQVYRALSEQALTDWRRASRQPFYERLVTAGRIIPTVELSPQQAACLPMPDCYAAVLQHEQIPFVTYPYEWCFSMLRQAALLHLEILTDAIHEGTILKDSSPYNVQYRGSRPVFIDTGSFVALGDGEPWAGYRQFCEMMLFPLLLQAYRQIDIQPVLRVRLDGISAREFLRPLAWRDMLRSGVFTHGWLQAMLESQAGSSQTDTIGALKSSGFDRSLIQKNLSRLTRLVGKLSWNPNATQWTRYRTALPHVMQDAETKTEFVQGICQSHRRTLVWDMGCNDGHFSRIAARHAKTVLAMDQDHGCVEKLYCDLAAEGSDTIVPLCIDLLNPSPALGWRGRERKRLEGRGQPDLVLCLGLIHHLVIAGNIPLPEVVNWLASLSGEVVIEFPSKRDPMVQRLLRNKQDQYADYSLPALEAALAENGFQIQRKSALPSGERTLLYATSGAPISGAI